MPNIVKAMVPALLWIVCVGGGAAAQTPGGSEVVARWIQVAPGSTPGALSAGRWGDAPLSRTPTVLARAVITGGACPAVQLDHGAELSMAPRFNGASLTALPGAPGSNNAKPGYPQYFVRNTQPAAFANGTPMATTSWTECELVVPAFHRTATIAGVDLALPVAHPKRILLIADTGCRMNGASQQDCASPTAFPWAYLAQYEATMHPDLIVQVGDWFYRDTPCNGAYPGCADPGSTNYEVFGDTFDSWNADVLFPAKPLLAAAPWVMARGNHESCGRGARGWFALLDPHPFSLSNVACAPSPPAAPANGVADYTPDFTPTYVVPTGSVNFLVHDSSFANDSAVAPATAENYDVDLTNALAALGPKSMNIFTTHKPSFGLIFGDTGTAANPNDNAGDFTEQSVFSGGTYAASAFRNGVPASIGLFLSGHIHQFEYISFKNFKQFAPQLIVGMGGTLLDPDVTTGAIPNGTDDLAPFRQQNQGFTVNNITATPEVTTARTTFAHDEFGFALLTAIDLPGGETVGYDADVYKISSERAGHCIIELTPRRSINCMF